MRCLLRAFPFLIADKVPEDDPYLNYDINLNQIIEIVFAPKIPSRILPYLHELILHHIKQFKKLFPFANPINKLHHMIHYVTSIGESGPLRNLACFIFGALHQLFKRHDSTCCNYKNIIKSMMNISQIRQCSIWGTKKKQIRKKIQFSHSEDVVEVDEDAELKIFLTQFKGKKIKMVDTVEVYGNQYEVGLYVAIDSGAKKIFVINESVYLYCQEWTSKYFKSNLNAYNIEEGDNVKFIDADDLCDPKPYSSWKPFSLELKYICLRYILI